MRVRVAFSRPPFPPSLHGLLTPGAHFPYFYHLPLRTRCPGAELCSATSAAIASLTQATFGVLNPLLLPSAPVKAGPPAATAGATAAAVHSQAVAEAGPVSVPGWVTYLTVLLASVPPGLGST